MRDSPGIAAGRAPRGDGPTAALAAVAARLPIAADPDPELERSLATLEWDVDSAALRTVAVAAAAVSTGLSIAAVAAGSYAVGAAMAILGAATGYGLLAVPGWLATVRRTRALGRAPELVALAVLRARVDPTAESAAAFAAENGSGPLATSLRAHVTAAHGTSRVGWGRFASQWGHRAPGLRRAASLIEAATQADPDRRDRLLDRAFEAVLAGSQDRAASFAAALRGPTSGLYAFGVVLPLSLVAGLPAIGGTSAPGLLPGIVLVYDVVLPLALLGTTAWLLGRRPVAFVPAPIPRSHPDVPDRRLPTVVVAGIAAALAWLGCRLLAPAWTVALVVPGVAAGAALVVWYRPIRRVRGTVSAVEAGLADALTIAGGRLQRGASPEAAVAATGEELDGAAGDVFARAGRRCRQLGVGVWTAFLGDVGALATVPSPRTKSAAELLVLAGREGDHGGRVLVDVAAHVDDLQAVERDARNEFAAIVGTLRSTACCFGPLVGGVTVGLTSRIAGDAVTSGTATSAGGLGTVDAGILGLAVGVYVLLLAVVLAVLATGLDRGLDRSLLGYHVGQSLLAASVVYPTAVVATGHLV